MSKFESATSEQLRAAITLAMHDVVFFGCYDETLEDWTDEPHPVILVNDIFYPAADGEAIPWDKCEEILELYNKGRFDAVIRWVADKRGVEPYAWRKSK